MRFDTLTPEEWRNVQLVYVCSPGNPTGHVMTLGEWKQLFELSDRYGFVIASDECYSEIYFEEGKPLLGSLQAAAQLGRDRYERLVMFCSLSKRSSVPGMRSGFVAGDADALQKFLLYRTYHGTAMSVAVQHASIAAWQDEVHVVENRRLYAQKFVQATPSSPLGFLVRYPMQRFIYGRVRRSAIPNTRSGCMRTRTSPCYRAAICRAIRIAATRAAAMSGLRWSHRPPRLPMPRPASQVSILKKLPMNLETVINDAMSSARRLARHRRLWKCAAVEQTIAQLDSGTLRVAESAPARGLCISG